jgi:predicted nucleic acid-binding Zn ribbon protein
MCSPASAVARSWQITERYPARVPSPTGLDTSAPVPNYQFRCPSCRAAYTLEASIHDDIPVSRPCPRCNHDAKRDYSFNLQPSFQEHFNNSLGQYVSNNRQFTDGLKIQSAEMSERMSQEVNLQPLSPAEMMDASSHGVTEEGLYETRKQMHDSIQ